MTLITQIEAIPILPHSLALWGLGQSGVIVKGPDAVIYIDPYLTNSANSPRSFAPPIQPGEITNADYILSTHEHIDHFDPQTLVPALKASPKAKVLASGWCVDLARNAGIDLDRLIVADEPLTLPGTSLRVTPVPSAHSDDYHSDYDPEKGQRWLGYLIEWNGVTLYHSGDNVMYEGYVETLRALPKPDVALLPINGRDWFREQQHLVGNFHPVEAVRLAEMMGWELLIPLHNDLFAGNSVSWTQFAAAIERFAPRQRFKQLQPGELLYYVKAT